MAAITHQAPSNDAVAVFSDDSRLDNGDCGYPAATQIDSQRNGWKSVHAYIGDNKEAYDAELFGIAAGLELASTLTVVRSNTSGRLRLFTDAQAALKHIQHDSPGPGQWLLPRIARAKIA